MVEKIDGRTECLHVAQVPSRGSIGGCDELVGDTKHGTEHAHHLRATAKMRRDHLLGELLHIINQSSKLT
jgi:hypothetical protein